MFPSYRNQSAIFNVSEKQKCNSICCMLYKPWNYNTSRNNTLENPFIKNY